MRSAFALASLLVVSSTISAASARPMKMYDSEMRTIADDVWPPVHVAYNFEVSFSFQQWEPTLGKLIPYANMSGKQYLDSNNNREYLEVNLNMDKSGMLPLKQVFDYNTHTMIEHVPLASHCSKYTVPQDIDVGTILDNVFSSQSGVTQFQGQEALPFDSVNSFGFLIGKYT